MARKNERQRTGGSKSSGRGKSAGARPGGARKRAGRPGAKAAAGRKAAGARKASGARKSAAARTTAGPPKAAAARKAPSRRPATHRGAARSGRAVASHARSGQQGASGSTGSTRRALWIESPEQNAERPGETLATRDHRVIMQWAEDRGAVPATISGTERDGRPGVLRFDFPNVGTSGGRLRQVDWDEWFDTFDQRNLVFRFQEQMKSGRPSDFFRLNDPGREEG
jgi:hypothetical protein